MIFNLEFGENVEGMSCDLNSIIGLCTNWPACAEENLSEGSHSLNGYLNVRSPAQNQKV